MAEEVAAVTQEPPTVALDTKGKKNDKGKGKGKGKAKAKDGKGKGWEFTGPTGSGGFRLNVKNLSGETTTKEQLKALFEPFGTVSSAEIKIREDGGSRGFGYVILATEAEGQKAIAEMNGKTVGGKALNVAPAERRPAEDDGGKGKGGNGVAGLDFAAQQQAAYMMQMQQAYMMQMQQMQMHQAYMASMAGGYPWPGMGAGQDPVAAAPGVPGTVLGQYDGTLKSVNPKNGYGFISCPETYALYNRDVYIDNELLQQGAKPGDQLRFVVTLNTKGHPKASSCTPI